MKIKTTAFFGDLDNSVSCICSWVFCPTQREQTAAAASSLKCVFSSISKMFNRIWISAFQNRQVAS